MQRHASVLYSVRSTEYHGEHTHAIVIDLHFESGLRVIPPLRNFMDRFQEICAKVSDNCIYLFTTLSSFGYPCGSYSSGPCSRRYPEANHKQT